MNNALEGKYCDSCGRRCPLSNPGCAIGADEAERILAGNEAPATESKPERHESHHGKHKGQHRHGERHGERRSHHDHQGHHEHHGHHHGHKSGAALSEDERLSRVMHHCARQLVHRERHQGGQAGMLAVLASHGQMSQARLAEKLGVRSASASELLAKMETEGLVKRLPDEEDGRAYKVELTESGTQAAAEVMADRRERDAHLFEALTPDEKQQLTTLLDKLARSWH